MTTTQTSLPTNINMISEFGYTLSWTNGASGTFTVEVCNDFVASTVDTQGVVPSPQNAGTWVTLTLSTPVVSTGTAGTAYLDIVGISAAWARLKFTNTASTGGTWTATIAGKAF